MILIENLNLKAGDFRLKSINLEIKKGECYALLGPSGSGKSTLVSAILGLVELESGRILLNGKDIKEIKIENRDFGYLPQNLALFPHLSVEANIRYGLKAKRIDSKEIESYLQRLIDITGIAPLLNRYPKNLSGGERQRVALVRALATRPKLLLLDEPFSALNISLKMELWHLIKSLNRSLNTTMLLITHDLNEASFLADRVSIIIDGKIYQSSTKDNIFRDLKSVEVAKYLGIKNIFKAQAISTKGNLTLFSVPSINSRLWVLGRVDLRDNCYLAIRSEDIKVDTKEDKNILRGSFSSVSMIDFDLVKFNPKEGVSEIEIILRDREKISKKDEISIYLPPNKISILRE